MLDKKAQNGKNKR